MMKKALCLVISLVMVFLTVLPSYAMAEPLYTYSSIQVNFIPMTSETEFRDWAYRTLKQYINDYLLDSRNLYQEYYNLASYKRFYDGTFGKETNMFGDVRTIAYTSESMTDEEIDRMIRIVIAQSLLDAQRIDVWVLEDADLLSSDDNFYDINADGTVGKNDMIASIDEKAAIEAANSLCDVVINTIDTALSTYTGYQKTFNPGTKGSMDIIDYLKDAATSIAKDLTDLITDELSKCAENELKEYVTKKIYAALRKASKEQMEYLQKAYLSSPSIDARTKAIALDLYGYYNSTEYANLLGQKANELSENQMKTIAASFGEEIVKELGLEEMIGMALIEVMSDILGNLVDSALKQTSKSEEVPLKKNLKSTASKFTKEVISIIKENWSDHLIETGKFDFAAGFDFDAKDWEKFLDKLKISGLMGKPEDFKSGVNVTVNDVNELFADTASLDERIGLLVAYYVVKGGEYGIKELIIESIYEAKDETRKENNFKNIGEWMSDFIKDLFKVVAQYTKDVISIDKEVVKDHINIDEKKIATKTNKFLEKHADEIDAVTVALEVASKAWNLGESIVEAAYNTSKALTGEDGMSAAAEIVNASEKQSHALHDDLMKLIGLPLENIKNPNQATIDEVWTYVSWMFKATELDANGSLNYLNTARIGKKRGNTTFMNLLNGNAVMVNVRLDQVFNIQLDLDSDIQITQIGSIGCIRYKYTNIYGGGGLLSEEAALKIYNSNVQWKDIVKIGFKDEWNALLDGDMDN